MVSQQQQQRRLYVVGCVAGGVAIIASNYAIWWHHKRTAELEVQDLRHRERLRATIQDTTWREEGKPDSGYILKFGQGRVEYLSGTHQLLKSGDTIGDGEPFEMDYGPARGYPWLYHIGLGHRENRFRFDATVDMVRGRIRGEYYTLRGRKTLVTLCRAQPEVEIDPLPPQYLIPRSDEPDIGDDDVLTPEKKEKALQGLERLRGGGYCEETSYEFLEVDELQKIGRRWLEVGSGLDLMMEKSIWGTEMVRRVYEECDAGDRDNCYVVVRKGEVDEKEKGRWSVSLLPWVHKRFPSTTRANPTSVHLLKGYLQGPFVLGVVNLHVVEANQSQEVANRRIGKEFGPGCMVSVVLPLEGDVKVEVEPESHVEEGEGKKVVGGQDTKWFALDPYTLQSIPSANHRRVWLEFTYCFEALWLNNPALRAVMSPQGSEYRYQSVPNWTM